MPQDSCKTLSTHSWFFILTQSWFFFMFSVPLHHRVWGFKYERLQSWFPAHFSREQIVYLQRGRTFTIFWTNVNKEIMCMFVFPNVCVNHVFDICQACFNILAGFAWVLYVRSVLCYYHFFFFGGGGSVQCIVYLCMYQSVLDDFSGFDFFFEFCSCDLFFCIFHLWFVFFWCFMYSWIVVNVFLHIGWLI